MANKEVVALGELLIDFTGSGTSPQGNPLMEANPGGAPCNVLSMLTKLGHSTAFIGKVGDDMFGRQLRDALVEVGVGTDGLIMDPAYNTTLAFVHTYPNGDRDFSFYRRQGADTMLRTEDLKNDLLENCRIFHYGSLSMTDDGCFAATKEAIRIAKEAGAVISFDPNLRPPLWDDGGQADGSQDDGNSAGQADTGHDATPSLDRAKERIAYGLSQCDVLKISDNEITWFTGLDSYDDGVAFLREKYPQLKLILVSLGPEGSMAFCGEERVVVKPFLNPDTIETTGAGDTFCACVLHYVLEHKKITYTAEELTQMLTFANAAASIITTRKGALRVMPEKAEVEAYLKERS